MSRENPFLHLPAPDLTGKAKAEAAQRSRLAAIQQDIEEELREQVLDLAESLSYAEAIRRLTGEQT